MKPIRKSNFSKKISLNCNEKILVDDGYPETVGIIEEEDRIMMKEDNDRANNINPIIMG